jgi:nicotinamidase-related amidase
LSRRRSVLVVVDVQERLFPHVSRGKRLLSRIDLLLAAAALLDIPVIVTEQYPAGLGGTVEEIRRGLPKYDPIEKLDFSCVPAPGFLERLEALQRDQIVLAGIETHVCIAQTAMELHAQGRSVHIAADAVSSQRPLDSQLALERLRQNGLTVTTAEAVVFEWLRRAGTAEFKALQGKLKALI